jgi:hypothetical protein
VEVNSLISTRARRFGWSFSRRRLIAPASLVLESTTTATLSLLAPSRVAKVGQFPGAADRDLDPARVEPDPPLHRERLGEHVAVDQVAGALEEQAVLPDEQGLGQLDAHGRQQGNAVSSSALKMSAETLAHKRWRWLSFVGAGRRGRGHAEAGG